MVSKLDAVVPSFLCTRMLLGYHRELGMGVHRSTLPLRKSMSQAGRGGLSPGWQQNPVLLDSERVPRVGRGLEARRASLGDLGPALYDKGLPCSDPC